MRRARPSLRVPALILTAAFKASPTLATVVLVFAVLAALTPVGIAATVQSLLDQLEAGQHSVLPTVLLLAAISSGWLVSLWIEASWQGILEERTDHWLEMRILAIVADVPGLAGAESSQFQDKLHTLVNRPRNFIGSISVLVAGIALILRLIASVAYLSQRLWLLGLVPVLLVIPTLGQVRIQKQLAEMLDRVATPMRTARMLFELATDSSCARDIRVFGWRSIIQERHLRELVRADEDQRRTRIATVRVTSLSWLTFALLLGVVLVVCNKVDGPALAAASVPLVILATQLIGQADSAALVVNSLGRQATFFAQLFWIADFAASRRARVSRSEPTPEQVSTAGELRLENVTFCHPHSARPALDSVDLTIRPGSCVAIVGPNGAGKSTLVKLLLRQYVPTSGRITIGGRDLQSLSDLEWPARTSAVFQDFVRPQVIMLEAVGMGDLTHLHDVPTVQRAMTAAGGSGLVSASSDGLRTPLGRGDGALEPSEGQWQSVAVARGLMRPAPVLQILDEPTASMDAEAEQRVFSRYLDAARIRSREQASATLLVSHRFSIARAADYVVVVNNGKVEQVGTHDELVDADGWYAASWTLQSSSFE